MSIRVPGETAVLQIGDAWTGRRYDCPEWQIKGLSLWLHEYPGPSVQPGQEVAAVLKIEDTPYCTEVLGKVAGQYGSTLHIILRNIQMRVTEDVIPFQPPARHCTCGSTKQQKDGTWAYRDGSRELPEVVYCPECGFKTKVGEPIVA